MDSNKKLLTTVLDFKITPEQLNESIQKNNGKIVLQGVVQRTNFVNGNGRYYSKSILQREVEKYMSLIKERRAVGELDHPSCFTESAQILTDSGWKYIKDISDDEIVFTLNTKTNNIELQSITKKIEEQYSGQMYRIDGKLIDTVVTPNHRFFVIDKKNSKSFKTAEELYLQLKNGLCSHYMIPIAGNWNSKYKKDSEFYSQNKKIKLSSSLFFPLIAIVLSNGKLKDDTSSIIVTVNNKEIAKKIRNLLSFLPSDIIWKESLTITKKYKFHIKNSIMWSYFNEIILHVGKSIPTDVKSANIELLQSLLEWYILLNDGKIVSDSSKLIDDLHEILIKLGKSANIKQIHKTSLLNGKKTYYELNCNLEYGIFLDYRFVNIETVDNFNGMVYCVNVPNSTFYVRDGKDGKAFWTGNSTVINLKNTSHLITELFWEGDDLIGKLELLTTPSGNIAKELIKCGVSLGISSRGLGSTTNIGNNTIEVQEDFELICFDLVSNPSTQGAFMQPITEGIDKLIASDSKYNKVNSIIFDILCEINN